MKNIINAIFTRYENYTSRVKLNWLKTIYFNFRTLPFAQAKKLPVFIYGKVKLMPLLGHVAFNNCEIKKGMVKLGRNTDCFSASKKCALIYMETGSRLIFDGPVSVSIDYTIYLRKNAVLQIGEYARVGAGVKFLCEENIKIGKYSIVTFDCQIIDTNFHFTINTKDNSVRKKSLPIDIGDFNWIGNKTTVMKGTKTQNSTIVTSSSLLNKDYTKLDNQKYPMLAGSPAKVIGSGYRRIFSLNQERDCKYFFEQNNGINTYVLPNEFRDTPEDMVQLF